MPKLNQKFTIMKIKFNLSLLLLLVIASCSNDDDNRSGEKRAYIVGFDPCTINHNYKIGYVIITEDLKDTLITYSISDETFKMPASIFLNENDTLYTIQESSFENYRNSIYFPNSMRNDYPINITYSLSKENEMVSYICSDDIISLILPQIIVNSLSK